MARTGTSPICTSFARGTASSTASRPASTPETVRSTSGPFQCTKRKEIFMSRSSDVAFVDAVQSPEIELADIGLKLESIVTLEINSGTPLHWESLPFTELLTPLVKLYAAA